MTLALSPAGRVNLERAAHADAGVAGARAERIATTFARGQGHGLLHLGTTEVATHLPGSVWQVPVTAGASVMWKSAG